MSIAAGIRPFSRPSSVQDAFFDTLTVSSDSQRTTTDTSTVWGPGTLSGRALLALGEVTIRGIDALLIRRRLATIRLRAPALTQSMCDDLLEFCRPEMYSPRVRTEALRLVSMQICDDPKYFMLVIALCKWNQQEARLILCELTRNLSGLVNLTVWQLERIYNFLVAIIQLKDDWRALVVEAGSLLRSTSHFQNLLRRHPIHTLCTESTGISALSTLQNMYAADMRSDTWLSLHMCGLLWQDRMLKIEKTIEKASHPELLAPELLDAIADVVAFTRSGFDFELQSSAISCLRQINNVRWKNAREFFGFDFPGATQPIVPDVYWQQQISAGELADAETYLRKLSSNVLDATFENLPKLCLCARYPPQITNAATLLILRNICHGSTRVAVSMCALSIGQMVLVIKTLVEDIHLVLCSLKPEEKMPAIHHFYDFLANVFQVNGSCCRRLSVDIAASIIKLAPTAKHPVVMLCTEIVEAKKLPPFSKIQALHSENGRHSLWVALQAAGFRLDAHMLEVSRILGASPKRGPTPRCLDALADAVIFTSEIFSSELRSSAIRCLLDHCVQSKQWEPLHQVSPFDCGVEKLMFTSLRDRLSQDDLYDFCRTLTYPRDSAFTSDLSLLLSGWGIGLQYQSGQVIY